MRFFILLIAIITAASSFAKELSVEMPDFILGSNSGKNIRLNELSGEVIMLNFWATWCGPCRKEMPEMEKLYNQYKKSGFTVLAVNIENSNNEKIKAKVDNFITEKQLTYPILYDSQKQVVTVLEDQFLRKNMAMPTTVFIDRDGNARFLHEGYKPGDEAKHKQYIETLLRE